MCSTTWFERTSLTMIELITRVPFNIPTVLILLLVCYVLVAVWRDWPHKWLSFYYGAPTTVWSHIAYTLLHDSPRSISSDQSLCVWCDHSGDHHLHGHCVILYLVGRRAVVITWAPSWSHLGNVIITNSWSGKPYAITTWAPGVRPVFASYLPTICCGKSGLRSFYQTEPPGILILN